MISTVDVKFLPFERVMTVNYRTKSRRWEPATIIKVVAEFNTLGNHQVTYNMLLDRRVQNPTKGNRHGLLFLNNIDTFIKPLEDGNNEQRIDPGS